MVTVVSLMSEGVKNSSLVTMFSFLPASMKFMSWSLASNSVTLFVESMLLKPLMTALRTTPPFVSSVSSSLSFLSTTCCEVPFFDW